MEFWIKEETLSTARTTNAQTLRSAVRRTPHTWHRTEEPRGASTVTPPTRSKHVQNGPGLLKTHTRVLKNRKEERKAQQWKKGRDADREGARTQLLDAGRFLTPETNPLHGLFALRECARVFYALLQCMLVLRIKKRKLKNRTTTLWWTVTRKSEATKERSTTAGRQWATAGQNEPSGSDQLSLFTNKKRKYTMCLLTRLAELIFGSQGGIW